ncbi:hypothetical protein [Streptomyces sp. cmx-4-9]|uniref:hypothetical protein n=1 Tax=Streptomyces sp. cmx-4-9 TaxID=2790941 RepID=UPI0039811978
MNAGRSFYWCRACRQPLYASSTATATAAAASAPTASSPVTQAAAHRDWEIDHQDYGDCANGPLMPLSGTAATPEDLPHAPRVLRLFGS